MTKTKAKPNEISEDEVKRILTDIRDIQKEIKLVNVHLIELEKYFMFIATDFQNNI